MKPFSDACERNRGPILEVLKRVLAERRFVLEIGSGSGQHAAGVRQWIAEPPPIELDVDFIDVPGDLGLLNQAQAIGRGAHALGVATMLLALAWGTWLVWQQYRRQRIT